MELKVLALSSRETESYYHRLRNALKTIDIDLTCLTEVPETISLLKDEKFNLALIDSDTMDLDNTCFKISWLCRLPLILLTGNVENEWGALKDIGVNNIISRDSRDEIIVTEIQNVSHKGRVFFPRVKILVIEDDRFIRDAISICFRIYWPEAEVSMAAAGREGVNLINQKHPDLILLDLGLPDISGLEVLSHIRSVSRIPIIILTANSDREHVVQAIQSGANDYMIKPFKQIDLLPRIRKTVDQLAVARK
jgi:CheY-like chemotaxis protein